MRVGEVELYMYIQMMDWIGLIVGIENMQKRVMFAVEVGISQKKSIRGDGNAGYK